MAKKDPIWRHYSTQGALRAEIQQRVGEQPFDEPFADTLISDLIAERHYFCSLKGLRPSLFKKTRENTPYRFYGQFAQDWHPVSWVKCLTCPPTKQEVIVRALRDRIEPLKLRFRHQHPVCAHCQQAPSAEVHHAEPSFQEIADQVLSSVSEREIDDALSTWDWFQIGAFAIADGHVIIHLFDALHGQAKLEALCKKCHNATKRRIH